MTETELATLVLVGGTLATALMSVVKRLKPDLSNQWKGVIILALSLILVWGYQIYKTGFDQMFADPWGTFLSMIAVTGMAVSLYQVLLKPITISPRIEGTFVEKK